MVGSVRKESTASMNTAMTIPVPDAFGQKALLWVGSICAILYGLSYLFLLDFWPPPSPLLSDEDVVALYAHSNAKFRFGVGVMIMTGAFFVPLSIPVSIQMARMEKGFPYLALLQLLTGLVGAWIFAWPAVLWGVCAFTVERAPEITVALHQLSWLTFITPGAFFWMQVGSVGMVAVMSRQPQGGAAFPRWFGWFTLWGAFEMSVFPTFCQMFWSGPFAWDGLLTFYVTVIYYAVWLSLLIWLIVRALGRQERSA